MDVHISLAQVTHLIKDGEKGRGEEEKENIRLDYKDEQNMLVLAL
jgi:hypothetical protein